MNFAENIYIKILIYFCLPIFKQIDEVIKDRDKVQVMTDHVEQLLVAMSMQFKIVYTTHMGDEDTPKEDVIRLYRVLLGTLLSVSTKVLG